MSKKSGPKNEKKAEMEKIHEKEWKYAFFALLRKNCEENIDSQKKIPILTAFKKYVKIAK